MAFYEQGQAVQWDDLKIYLAILRSGSVRAAAGALGISHSTVLRRLDSLEEAIGVTLFHRLPTGYELTADGESLRQRAEDIELSAIAFQRGATGVDQDRVGKLTVTMPEPFAIHYFVEHFGAFHAAHPEIELEIVFAYDVLDLSRRAADVAVRFMSEPDGQLIGRRLPNFAEAYYASKEYLNNYDLDDPDSGACWIGWRDTADWVEETPFPQLPVRWNMPSVCVQLASCKSGFGLTQLPCFIGDRAPDLVRVPGSQPMSGRDGWVLYHEDLKGTPRVTSFTNFLVNIVESDRALIEGRALG